LQRARDLGRSHVGTGGELRRAFAQILGQLLQRHAIVEKEQSKAAAAVLRRRRNRRLGGGRARQTECEREQSPEERLVQPFEAALRVDHSLGPVISRALR
jgi:hypothetical protein